MPTWPVSAFTALDIVTSMQRIITIAAKLATHPESLIHHAILRWLKIIQLLYR
jgi:hypothetical protein